MTITTEKTERPVCSVESRVGLSSRCVEGDPVWPEVVTVVVEF